MEISCITLSGPHGAGTSSAGKELARRLGFRFVSAGVLFRESADQRGINIGEFTRIVEGDQFLKDELDNQIKEEAKKGNVIVEGRIVGWTTKEIANLRVFLTAPLEIRVKRIAEREGKPLELARSETVQREKEEYDWFLKTYGIDILDETVYDLTIDTSSCNIDCVIDTILKAASNE